MKAERCGWCNDPYVRPRRLRKDTAGYRYLELECGKCGHYAVRVEERPAPPAAPKRRQQPRMPSYRRIVPQGR